MAASYHRALATCTMLRNQLKLEQDSRKAMELCFKKIYKSLDLYQGHPINRIRFHMDRHHTEYLRYALTSMLNVIRTDIYTARYVYWTTRNRRKPRLFRTRAHEPRSGKLHDPRRSTSSNKSLNIKTSRSRLCAPYSRPRIHFWFRPMKPTYKRSNPSFRKWGSISLSSYSASLHILH